MTHTEFIVKACNSHAKLVEALGRLVSKMKRVQDPGFFRNCTSVTEAEDLLQQLKEKTND
jgi:hypothetical protein